MTQQLKAILLLLLLYKKKSSYLLLSASSEEIEAIKSFWIAENVPLKIVASLKWFSNKGSYRRINS